MGLPDSTTNRRVSEVKARIIEGDLATGNFDKTLAKYKPERLKQCRDTVQVLLKAFWHDKGKRLKPHSLENYRAAVLKFESWAECDSSVESITREKCERFCDWLNTQGLAPTTAKTYVTLLSALWDWGAETERVKLNPWKSFTGFFKAKPHQKLKPFDPQEIGAILEAFRLEHPHYYPFVAFLLGSGCRIGEAIALRWGNVSEDCSRVTICESVNRGLRSGTKTGRDRTFNLTPALQRLLIELKPQDPAPELAVFKTPSGCLINRHNFRNRLWEPILRNLEIDYRKPYTTRASLISNALELGHSPLSISELTGNSPRVIYQSYAGSVGAGKLPEVLLGADD